MYYVGLPVLSNALCWDPCVRPAGCTPSNVVFHYYICGCVLVGLGASLWDAHMVGKNVREIDDLCITSSFNPIKIKLGNVTAYAKATNLFFFFLMSFGGKITSWTCQQILKF